MKRLLTPAFESVAAILLVHGAYALQRRDDRNDLPFPGCWNVFGGSVESGETPLEAIRREIHEELNLAVTEWTALWRIVGLSPFRPTPGRVVVFGADVTAGWSTRRLGEGQADGLFAAGSLPEPIVPFAEALILRHHDVLGRRAVVPRSP